MADLLKITTPLVNKNQQVQPKPGVDPTAPFSLQDISKVIQPQGKGETLKQNNGLIQQDTPTILANLLKDPAVTVTFLRNICMLEEIIKLLPANNRTVTEEIEQMFQTLMVNPGEVAAEMMHQESTATSFRGELFDFLRQISADNAPQADIQGVIANLLRSINHLTGNDDILDAVANSLQYLKENLESSQSLAPKLQELMQRFQQPDAGEKFHSLKKEALALLKDVQDSILYNPKLEKVVSITIYNLSRFNDNTDYLQESAATLWRMLNGEQRRDFRTKLSEFLQSYRENHGADRPNASRVMDILIKLIGKEAGEEAAGLTDSGKADKIIHSLLSSPCNFTPLLHFVVPMLFEDIKSFAEIWINPHAEDEDEKAAGIPGIHLLLVIDVETAGRFEVELFVRERTIDFSLFCPQGYEQQYSETIPKLSKTVASLSYRLGDVRVERLDHSRSLMEVFKSLPYKRAGVDVKI